MKKLERCKTENETVTLRLHSVNHPDPFMPLVTLTTDLGTRDFYLAALKGAIISHSQITSLIDVTHHIKPFDIKEAAFVIGNAYKYFPKETIHVIHVNSSEGKGKLLLAVIDGHYFITFDNGILSLAFEQTPHQTYEVNEELLENNSLLFEEPIARVIELLSKEYKPSDFAQLTTETISFRLLQPVAQPNNIRGTVIYIDQFGNGITNITQKMFADCIGTRIFTIDTNVAGTRRMPATKGNRKPTPRLFLDGAPELLFDAGDLGVERAGVTLAIVELGGDGDAVAIDRDGFDRTLEHVEQLIHVALDLGAHRVQTIIEPAFVDHIHCAGHVFGHALAGAQRRDAKVENRHRTTSRVRSVATLAIISAAFAASPPCTW